MLRQALVSGVTWPPHSSQQQQQQRQKQQREQEERFQTLQSREGLKMVSMLPVWRCLLTGWLIKLPAGRESSRYVLASVDLSFFFFFYRYYRQV